MKHTNKILFTSTLMLTAFASMAPTVVSAKEQPPVQQEDLQEDALSDTTLLPSETEETTLTEEGTPEEVTEEVVEQEVVEEAEKEEIPETLHNPVVETLSVPASKEPDASKNIEQPMLATFSLSVASTPQSDTVTVQAGDTLNKIAARTHTTVDQLVKWNNIANKNIIRVGQTLVLHPKDNHAGTQEPTVPAPKEDLDIKKNLTQQEFIDIVAPVAKEVAKANNLYASVMIAQASLESGFGKSTLSSEPNYNMFGIKGEYQGESVGMYTNEYENGKWIRIVQDFKKYPNFQASFEDNAKLLRNGLTWNKNFYSGTWIENTKSFQDATLWLQGRYATDPAYANKLNNIIQSLNLTQFDAIKAIAEKEPEKKPVVKLEVKPVTAPTPTPTPKPVAKPVSTASSSTQSASYTIKRGDTLSHIARQYKTTVANLKQWNGLKSDLIFVGQKLIVSKASQTPKPAPAPVKTVTPASTQSKADTNKVVTKSVTYTIKRGDTLSKIAREFKTTVSALKSLNNLRSDLIFVGQKLQVTKATTQKNSKPVAPSSSAKTATPAPSKQTYKIKSGDTLSHIARQYKTTVANLKKLNNLKSDLIFVNQTIRVK